MREIKFRIWDKISQKMYEDIQMVAPHENEILMQFTGLLDKQGKEIFEGDIVKWAGYVGVVSWVFDATETTKNGKTKEIGSWFFNNGFVVDLANDIYQKEWVNLDSDFKIIGNIYENPELLEQPFTK